MFVRTKDGVYELKENMTIEKGVFSFFGKIYDTTEKHLFKNDKDLGEVVKQSENLEELCDEFVFVLNHSETGKENEYMTIKKSNLEYFKLLVKDIKNSVLYGAIWTSKGLIYVAKMNENGELVLI